MNASMKSEDRGLRMENGTRRSDFSAILNLPSSILV
jgi:hypothetical protein